MTLQKRCGRACQLYATYTWSHAIDDAPEQNNIDSSNFLSDPTNRRRDRANSLTDKRHVFNMTGVFLPEFHVSHGLASRILNGNQLSLTIQAASGDLFNIGSNRQLNLDSSEPAAFQRPLFVGRNTFRAPAVFELNARYSRFFPIAERFVLEFLAETTNLTNTLNVVGVNSTALVEAANSSARPEIGSIRHASVLLSQLSLAPSPNSHSPGPARVMGRAPQLKFEILANWRGRLPRLAVD